VPLNIAMVTQAYRPAVGGVTEHVHGTAAALRARGHRVTVITSGQGRSYRDQNGHEKDVVRLGRNFTVLYNGADNNITLGLGLHGAMRAQLESGGFDVVHVHCPLSPSLPILAIRSARQPVVGTFHSVSVSDRVFRVFRPILRPFYDRLARVIAVSEPARAEVLRNFPGPITIVPNGVDLARFRRGVEPLPQFSDGIPNVLFVGRFDPRKGLPELMRACASLRDEGLDFRLILVGDGRLRRIVERAAKHFPPGRVVLEGQVQHDRLPRYYASADIFCTPARGSESFGLVLLEAMAHGVPVVATDIPGYRSVVTHEQESLLVPPRDPGALARALGALLRDRARRERMGAAGVQTAARYGWDSVAERLEEIYLDVIGRDGNGAGG
jgi:phosphatidylinositol alpha-mannosyltransferase